MNIADTTSQPRTVATYTRDASPAGGTAVEIRARAETRTQPAGTGHIDAFVASTITDQSAMYDVTDIRRKGGGHILPRYQITHRLTLEGNKRVEKLVDVALATERKSLRIYREQQ